MRWVDVNKGTEEVPKVRSRLVGQEFTHGPRRDDLCAPTHHWLQPGICCAHTRVGVNQVPEITAYSCWTSECEREGIVGGDEGPVGGVAQVVSHGVKVVGAHGEEGQEKDGEVRGEVKGEVEQLREKRSSWMVCG